jgi:TPR repeat protein
MRRLLLYTAATLVTLPLLVFTILLWMERPQNSRWFYNVLCELDSAGACNKLAIGILTGAGNDIDKCRADELHARACDLGSADSCYWAGTGFNVGHYCAKDPARALSYFERGCYLGDKLLCDISGDMYENGNGTIIDHLASQRMFTYACELGSSDACYKVAIYYEAEGSYQSGPKAYENYIKACNLEHGRGCYSAGIMKYEGTITRKNEIEAIELFGRACDLGVEDGCLTYAKLKM